MQCRVILMSYFRRRALVFVVRCIGAAMNRRESFRLCVWISFSHTAARPMVGPMSSATSARRVSSTMLSSPASHSCGRADLEFIYAPRRRVRRGAFSLRLCARRAVSRSVPLPAVRRRYGRHSRPAALLPGSMSGRLIGCGCGVARFVLALAGAAVRLSGRLCSPAAGCGVAAGRRRADLVRLRCGSAG